MATTYTSSSRPSEAREARRGPISTYSTAAHAAELTRPAAFEKIMHRILHALATEQFATLEAAATLEEWIVRPYRRRAAARALDAASATKLSALHDLARIARLGASGVSLGSGFDDAAAVAHAYAMLPAPPPRRAPMVTLGLVGILAVLATAAIAFRIATRPFDAAAKGTGAAFARSFGTHVADVANGARPAPDDAMRRVFPSGLEPPAGAAMKELFAAQVEAAGDASRMPAVFEKARAVNDAFAALGQPWFVDARYYRDAPLLYAFYREREDEGRADGFAPERVVYLWRLDRLNISKAALGYTHREAGAALVLYDQVEEFLIQDVLPALAEGEKLELIDTPSRDATKAWQDDIETRAARMVRESFAGAADRDRLVELGALLARRRAIVRKWRSELAAQNRILREPNRLIPEADYAGDLLHRVSSSSRHEWEDVHDALASRSAMTTFEALRDRFADDVARHELQHRFDAQRTKECDGAAPCVSMVVPAAVRARVGPKGEEPVAIGSMTGRVRNETSAYLAQMASPSGMPKMTLLSLLRTVLDREAWGDVYCNTTIVLLDVLAAELGLVDEGMPLVAGGAVQRASVASLVALLFAKPDEELRRVTAKIWRDLFASELPAPSITRTHQAQRWRH